MDQFDEMQWKDLGRGVRHLAWYLAQTLDRHKGSTSERRLRDEIARLEALAARCDATALEVAAAAMKPAVAAAPKLPSAWQRGDRRP